MKSNVIPPLECDNGDVIYNTTDKAELFNSFFVKQASVESKNDTVPNLSHVNNQITPLTISPEYVFEILSNLDINKAVGPDLVHNKILKSCAGVLAAPLTAFFNRSLHEGKFPTIWKTAHVTPIHKKKESTILTTTDQYRFLAASVKLWKYVFKGTY